MMATLFTERQLSTLRAFCDTLIPALDATPDPGGLYARAASDLHIAETLSDSLPDLIDATSQLQLKLFLDVLDQPLVNGLFGRILKPFAEMTLAERTMILRDWSSSPIALRRQAFQSIKRLAFLLFYSVLDAENSNPNWAAIDYRVTAPRAPTERAIKPLIFTEDTTLRADAVIIGSGAGGGVMAGELSAAGLDVIVLEKGGYYAEADFSDLEVPSNQQLFENKGVLTTTDLGVIILAGSTLGGGTVVNWSASFRTPDHVLAEWERDYGLTGFSGSSYQRSLDAVSHRINVNEDESLCNRQNGVLEKGATALGYTVKTIPRNVRGCEDCGFCNFGCQFGAKQSTLKTYLQDAHERGARIAVNVQVERVLIEYGRAVGVVGTALNADGRPIQLTVRAKTVVAAAGSLHTPALLLRSGLSNAHIGSNLHLHPTTVTYGLYDEPVIGWAGVPMSRYVSNFSDLDGAGYGVVLETAPLHPGIGALSLAWSDGAQHKRVMANLRHLSNIIVIARDHDGGRVTIDRRGQPKLHYTLSARDNALLARGVDEALRIHAAAGAYEISGPHSVPHLLQFGKNGGTPDRTAAVESFIGRVRASGWGKNSFALFSAHQMSSCRMAGSPALGALDPTGESFEVRGLFVADASVLPTAVGRNPMVTIMAVAHQIAGHIKARHIKREAQQ